MDDLVDLFETSFSLIDEYDELIYNLNLISTEKNINNLIYILHKKNQYYYKNIIFEEKIKEENIIKQILEECLNINFINHPYLYIKHTKFLLEEMKHYIDNL